MKKSLVYLVLLSGLISCSINNNKVITLTELKQLLISDSVSRIVIVDNKTVEVFTLPVKKKNKPYFLKIESIENFEDSLKLYQNSLPPQNVLYAEREIKNNLLEYLIVWILPILILLIFFILFLVAIIDVLKNKFGSDINKLTWVLVILFIPLIGSILYIFIGRKQKIE